ncbi:polysaccharide export protein Wza [Halomonas daqingensis]|uniref:Polysaccharide export protein Wza n=2 Tax=Billgrantia desiderata TaxID=52021 RepID=A0AAW4YS67_9GAMM|nr:polysaccharide export protein Wza [Halomonas desiderata]OUE38272.1 polysaccharide export protein Wza [Halomonas desiderata SP1]MCE8040826.1 polysaccharide export protein Wza [Halomonas desiderata]MCE8045401.1 polysaccharide export protein Wza [Halomonas desiderata]MCE8050801.1 polysaccharide export protein Wza [Halomonas desiderata]
MSRVLLSCSVLLMGGCAFAPGGHIDYRTDAAPIDDLVDIEPITFGLVRALRQERRQVEDFSRGGEALQQDIDGYDYYIGKGDVLTVIVYGHPELTIPAGGERSAAESGNTVHSDGTIFYPFIGRIPVEGRTVREVRDVIARGLEPYVAMPQVEVQVAQYNSQRVNVTGAVADPGPLPIRNVPLTVLDAISQSGGLADHANWHDVLLTRDGEEIRLSLHDMLNRGRLDRNLLLRAGDVLHVPDNSDQKVYVMGEVREPRSLAMGANRLTLTDALSEAGGINEGNANASGIFVIRRAPEESDKLATVYQLDARNATALMLGAEFALEPTDVIYVTTTPLGRWNRVVRQILPTVSSIYQTTRTGRELERIGE